jgi:hypothetical protein
MKALKSTRVSLTGTIYIIEYIIKKNGGTYRIRRGEFGSYTRWMSSADMNATLKTLGFMSGSRTKRVMDMAVESLFSRGSITLSREMVESIVNGLGSNKVSTFVYSRVKTEGDNWTIPAKIAKDPKVYKYLSKLMNVQHVT